MSLIVGNLKKYDSNATYTVGQRYTDNDGTEYIYVKSGTGRKIYQGDTMSLESDGSVRLYGDRVDLIAPINVDCTSTAQYFWAIIGAGKGVLVNIEPSADTSAAVADQKDYVDKFLVRAVSASAVSGDGSEEQGIMKDGTPSDLDSVDFGCASDGDLSASTADASAVAAVLNTTIDEWLAVKKSSLIGVGSGSAYSAVDDLTGVFTVTSTDGSAAFGVINPPVSARVAVGDIISNDDFTAVVTGFGSSATDWSANVDYTDMSALTDLSATAWDTTAGSAVATGSAYKVNLGKYQAKAAFKARG
jgi:hypothetical protein